MSAFVGKIHYWLYNKIKLHEDLIEEVAKSAANLDASGTNYRFNRTENAVSTIERV